MQVVFFYIDQLQESLTTTSQPSTKKHKAETAEGSLSIKEFENPTSKQLYIAHLHMLYSSKISQLNIFVIFIINDHYTTKILGLQFFFMDLEVILVYNSLSSLGGVPQLYWLWYSIWLHMECSYIILPINSFKLVQSPILFTRIVFLHIQYLSYCCCLDIQDLDNCADVD